MAFNNHYPDRVFTIRNGAADPLPFTQINTTALRVVHLASRHGLTADRAAMLAAFIWGCGRAD